MNLKFFIVNSILMNFLEACGHREPEKPIEQHKSNKHQVTFQNVRHKFSQIFEVDFDQFNETFNCLRHRNSNLRLSYTDFSKHSRSDGTVEVILYLNSVEYHYFNCNICRTKANCVEADKLINYH